MHYHVMIPLKLPMRFCFIIIPWIGEIFDGVLFTGPNKSRSTHDLENGWVIHAAKYYISAVDRYERKTISVFSEISITQILFVKI